jgi:cytochrome P450
MVTLRREAIKRDPSMADSGDLLSIMLNESLFENNDDQIIDESLTFFIAGTIT